MNGNSLLQLPYYVLIVPLYVISTLLQIVHTYNLQFYVMYKLSIHKYTCAYVHTYIYVYVYVCERDHTKRHTVTRYSDVILDHDIMWRRRIKPVIIFEIIKIETSRETAFRMTAFSIKIRLILT